MTDDYKYSSVIAWIILHYLTAYELKNPKTPKIFKDEYFRISKALNKLKRYKKENKEIKSVEEDVWYGSFDHFDKEGYKVKVSIPILVGMLQTECRGLITYYGITDRKIEAWDLADPMSQETYTDAQVLEFEKDSREVSKWIIDKTREKLGMEALERKSLLERLKERKKTKR